MTNTIRLIAVTLIFSVAASGCSLMVAGTVAGTGAVMAKDRRNVENIIEDEVIELRATDAIYSDKIIGKHVRINITAFNGIVLLTGEAPTEEMRTHAGQVAYAMRNVREVYNEIQVKEPISVERRANDSWLATKVKTTLIADRGLFTRARVVASDGAVYLMGLVTPAEADKIKASVNNIEGVDAMIPLFEPLDTNEEDILRSTRVSIHKNAINQDKKETETRQEENDMSVLPYVDPPQIQLTDGDK